MAELCREHGMSNASFHKWQAKFGGMDASLIGQVKAIEDENRRLKRMYGLEHASRSSEGSFRKKMTRPSQRCDMAELAVARHNVSIALACRAFGVSETCYRYSPKLKDENEEIADLLVGLTDARKTWASGCVFCTCAM